MTQLLLVDDDDDSLSLLAMVLSRRGLQVHTARSLAEAQERLAEHVYDVVVTDLDLGDGDGASLASSLPKTTRLVLVSGSVSPSAQGDVCVGDVRAPALLKPVDVERLIAIVQKHPEAR